MSKNYLPIVTQALTPSDTPAACDGCDGTTGIIPAIRLTGLVTPIYLCPVCAVNLSASIERQLTLARQWALDAERLKI